MEKFKSSIVWIVGIITALFGLFLFGRSKEKQGQAAGVDNVLQFQQKEEQAHLDKVNEEINELKKKHLEEQPKELTPTQVEEYWKNKK